MTLEEYLAKHCGPSSYGEQDENGVDLSLIGSNFELTPLERLRRGDRATSDALWVRANVKRDDRHDEVAGSS